MVQAPTTDPEPLVQRCKFCNEFEPCENSKDITLIVGSWTSAHDRTDDLSERRCSNCSILETVSQRIEQFLGDDNQQYQFNFNDISLKAHPHGLTLVSIRWRMESISRGLDEACAIIREVTEVCTEQKVTQALTILSTQPGLLKSESVPAPSQPGCNVMSDESLDFLRRRLEDCKSQKEPHSDCPGGRAEPTLPTRLLYVGSDTDSIRLHESEPYSRGVYVALSHCWGPQGSRLIKTTAETLDQNKESIRWESLTAVYQDSIRLCRMLGVEYLWIDSLCIIQDNHDDWEVESSKMAEYYSQATFTIAVESSPDGNVSFLGTRQERWQSQTYTVHDRHGIEHYYSVQEHCDLQSKNARRLANYFREGKRLLTNRAWAFQEYLLSRRLIRFTPSGIVWQCSAGVFLEQEYLNGVIKPPSLIPDIHYCTMEKKLNAQQDPAFREWGAYLNAYSRRDLTYESDRLPSLSGIAARIQDKVQGQYLAGIWADHLPYSLCWRRPLGAPTTFVDPENTIPTWSWASLPRTEVYYLCLRDDGWQPLAECHRPRILETFCQMSDKAPFGRAIKGAFLLMEAPLFEVIVSTTDDDYKVRFRERQKVCSGKLRFAKDCILDLGRDQARRATNTSHSNQVSVQKSIGWVVWLARMDYTTFGLVLGKDSQSTGFQRLGILTANNIYWESFDTSGTWTTFKLF